MKQIIIKKLSRLIFMALVFLSTGCIKETYDMNRLSERMHLNPTMALMAMKGDISFSDLVKSGDTVVFDQNNFVKIIFKEDSILDMKMEDFYDLDDIVAFSESYGMGDMNISVFNRTMNFSLNQISMFFPAPLRAQFVALDNTTNNFPAIPQVNLGENAFPLINNLEHAVISSGTIDISIRNNLAAPLDDISIQLFNSVGHTAIGSPATIPLTQPGELGITSIDLTGAIVTNSIIAAIIIQGSPGTSTPVLINLNGSNIEVGIQVRDLKVKSGRVIIPLQTLILEKDKDTITFVPGADIELDEVKVAAGNISYNLQSTNSLAGSFALQFPAARREGSPLTETIIINPNSTRSGTISVDNTIADLGTDPLQPFNRMPIEYIVTVSSNGKMIDVNENDQIHIDLNLLNPDFDFVKGYFGQEDKVIDPYIFSLDTDDIISRITGDFQISNPSIKINYSNSFAIPMEIELDATGHRNAKSVDLGLGPFNIAYPAAPADRDISATFIIDKTNSSLPALISLPPEEIRFSGLAKMNPQGNSGARDNYIFGNSRFIGSLEMEVPLEFRANNLQFTDTADNFMKVEESDEDNPIKPENFEFLRIDLSAKNGFPLGVSLKLSLYDPLTHTVKSSVDAKGILGPAPVDSNGKVNGINETSTSIEFTKEFFSSINKADKIIFHFTLVTTGDGSKDVKIYSDYRIDFKAALVLKPDIILK